MRFNKGDEVVLHDRHSEHDDTVGEVTAVMETMFGDETYNVEFQDGVERGVAVDLLEPADERGHPTEIYDPEEGSSNDETRIYDPEQ
jgi:hypothetical protein